MYIYIYIYIYYTYKEIRLKHEPAAENETLFNF